MKILFFFEPQTNCTSLFPTYLIENMQHIKTFLSNLSDWMKVRGKKKNNLLFIRIN